MSESKRTELTETLTALDTQDRLWAISFLAQLLAEQPKMRKGRIVKRYHNTFTDDQWEEHFQGQPVTELPTETPSIDREFLQATAGKTIEPLKKWL